MPVPNIDGGPVSAPGGSGIVPPHQRQAIEMVDSVMEAVAQVSLTEISQDVLDLPPEKRFTESVEEFAKIYGIEDADSPDKENVPEEIRNISDGNQAIRQMANLFGDIANALQDRTLSIIAEKRGSPNPYLYALVLLDQLEDAMSELERRRLQEIDDGRGKMATSRLVTLQSYLVKIFEGGINKFDESHIRDILRARYYGEKLRGRQPDWDPEELNEDQVRSIVRAQGAMMVYQEREISLSRGAELAGISVSGFRSYLEDRDVDIRYDVNSVEEFENDPSL